MNDPCVALQGVGKRFAEQWVLRNLSFSCPAGETTAIVGESGSGKSTLLQLINAVYLPDAGSIEVFGQEPPTIDTAHYRRGIGYAVQGAGLFPHMTVQRNVTLLAKLEGWSEADIGARFDELLGLMGLDTSLARRYPNQLSGGQQQRVALARALAPNPMVLLLDEPLSALDAKVRAKLRGEVRNLQKRLDITTIMVTHDQEEAMEMADRVVVMNEGRIEQVGTPTDLYYRPANLFVADFLGKMNVLRLEEKGVVPPRLAGRLLSVEGEQPKNTEFVYVRPEAVEVLTDLRPGTNRFPGRVNKTTFLGNLTRVELEVGKQHLAAELRYKGASSLQPGQEVTVYLPPEAVLTIAEP